MHETGGPPKAFNCFFQVIFLHINKTFFAQQSFPLEALSVILNALKTLYLSVTSTKAL